MKKILMATLAFGAIVLVGCNTMKGVGKDVSKVGDVVTDTADKTSNEIKRN